jgi:hypothetical protein
MASGDARGGANINVVMHPPSIGLTPMNSISSSRKQYDPESKSMRQEMLINQYYFVSLTVYIATRVMFQISGGCLHFW